MNIVVSISTLFLFISAATQKIKENKPREREMMMKNTCVNLNLNLGGFSMVRWSFVYMKRQEKRIHGYQWKSFGTFSRNEKMRWCYYEPCFIDIWDFLTSLPLLVECEVVLENSCFPKLFIIVWWLIRWSTSAKFTTRRYCAS